MVCPNCGAAITATQRFCDNCGQPLRAGAPPTGRPMPAQLAPVPPVAMQPAPMQPAAPQVTGAGGPAGAAAAPLRPQRSGRLRAPLRGTVSQFRERSQAMSRGQSGSVTTYIWTFLVNQPDASGNLVPVSVQMRGVRFDGAVHDGDEVVIADGSWKRGTLTTQQVRNTRTGQEVTAMGLFRTYRVAYIAVGTFGVCLLVAMGVFALHVFGLFSGLFSSTFGHANSIATQVACSLGNSGGGNCTPGSPLEAQSDTQAIKCGDPAFKVTLVNNNGQAVQWRVDRVTQVGGQDWASVSPSSGTIGPNQNTVITVTPSANLCSQLQSSAAAETVFVAMLDPSTRQPTGSETQIDVVVSTF